MYFTDVTTAKKTDFNVAMPGQHVFFVYNKSCNLNVTLSVSDAEVYIFGLFIGNDKDQFTLHTIQNHAVGKNKSNLFIKGVFKDQSKFKYEGLIRIEKGADGSHAYQKNQNLILSPDVFVESKPDLEILANDVFCTHGSTTGKIDSKQIEYAQSRGITVTVARQMLVEGFVEDLFQKMVVVNDEADEIIGKLKANIYAR